MSPLQRTIAMPVLPALSIFIAVFFSGCADKIKTDINAFKALDESLINSNIMINKSSQTLLISLEQKLFDPPTAYKAEIWQPKAMLIQQLSKNLYSYIDGLKADLKKEAGLKTEEGRNSFKEDDKNAVTRLFKKKVKGDELFEQLKNYKHDVLAIDIELDKEFKNTILSTTSTFDDAKEKQDFTKNFFDDIPAIAALAMLSKFQNNIRVAENRMINFCDNKCPNNAFRYDTYSAIITKSSSYVKASEEIEIISGVGAFSKAAQPVIKINGKNVSLDADGAAHYIFKASYKPGKHIVPVEISFTDQDGKKQTVTKNIEYTVAKEAEINN